MIVPKNFEGLSLITDNFTNKKMPTTYLTEAGMVRMNQKRSVYYQIEDEKNQDLSESDQE